MEAFDKILVANRGEIAVRVIRTAREMGYRTVAVYSDADCDAIHVDEADEGVCIGPAPVGDSYLNIDNIMQAAEKTAANAIHPGYGFLSENPDFARRCAARGIAFIGPTPEVIELMGSKRLSKLAMVEAGVPCIPGYQGEQQSDEVMISEAKAIGYPVMIKASAGGGGRGMRLVKEQSDMVEGLKMARSEAVSAFGSDELILEKAIIDARHIEIQVFADNFGNCVYLHERDCSVQRRHQKVVEEAPSPFVDQSLRQRMGEAAVKVAKSCQYTGAGTVEFLVDNNGQFYFLEMNTRLQVEHPVTEMITHQDLVAWQFKVATGLPLPLSQEEIPLHGHAVEVRLYAEDPTNNFLPQTGRVERWEVEPRAGIRVDSGIRTGSVISSHYDPMIAKVVAWGDSRLEACRKLASALEDLELLGFKNNKGFLTNILRNETFLAGEATTSFLQQESTADLAAAEQPDALTLGLATLLCHHRHSAQHNSRLGWKISSGGDKQYKMQCNGSVFDVTLSPHDTGHRITVGEQTELIEIHAIESNRCRYNHNGIRKKQHFVAHNNRIFIESTGGHYQIDDVSLVTRGSQVSAGNGEVLASMDGVIVDVLVEKGAKVSKGDTLIILEAMKMEHPLRATVDGTVDEVRVKAGHQVKVRQILCNVMAD